MKLRVSKKRGQIDESVVTDALIKHWRNNASATSYLRLRFPKPDPTGDFLKAIIAVRAD